LTIERDRKRGTKVLLALLLVGGGGSSIARADCGYGVSSKHSRFFESALRDMTFEEYTGTAADDRSTSRKSEHKPSCAGARCSRPYESSKALVRVLTLRNETRLPASAAIPTTWPEAGAQCDGPFVPRPRRHASRLERPPKT
jgi:hypothetical protein